MGEIADLRPRALYDFPIGLDELVHLRCKRRHILWELARNMLRLAAADRRHSVAQRA
jgi:hypothetical protein